MKQLTIISFLVAALVFAFVFYIQYRLLSAQLEKDPLSTSFPPSSAWLIALPWALGVFVVILIIGWLVARK
jgi:ABC-type antimicrobial peptide transport system permease subunit